MVAWANVCLPNTWATQCAGPTTFDYTFYHNIEGIKIKYIISCDHSGYNVGHYIILERIMLPAIWKVTKATACCQHGSKCSKD
jgi:hypothetical protein